MSLNSTLLSSIGNSLSSTNVFSRSCPFSAAVSRSISIAWLTNTLFAIFCSLCSWLAEKTPNLYKTVNKEASSRESRFILPLVVSLWVLHSSSDSSPKAILDSLATWGRKFKDNAHLLRADEDFVILIIPPPSYQCTRAIPGSDQDPPGWTAVGSAWQQNFPTQTPSGLLMEVDASHSDSWFSIDHSWHNCNAWNRATSSGRRGGANRKFRLLEHARTTVGYEPFACIPPNLKFRLSLVARYASIVFLNSSDARHVTKSSTGTSFLCSKSSFSFLCAGTFCSSLDGISLLLQWGH